MWSWTGERESLRYYTSTFLVRCLEPEREDFLFLDGEFLIGLKGEMLFLWA